MSRRESPVVVAGRDGYGRPEWVRLARPPVTEVTPILDAAGRCVGELIDQGGSATDRERLRVEWGGDADRWTASGRKPVDRRPIGKQVATGVDAVRASRQRLRAVYDGNGDLTALRTVEQ